MRGGPISAAIEESALLLRVAVQVQHHADLPLLVGVQYLVFYVVDLGVELFRWVFPPAVEVAADQRAPVVTVRHAVWVHHGENFEDEGVSEGCGLGGVGDQKFDEEVDYPAGDRFACVGAGHYHDHRYVRVDSSETGEVGYGEHFQAVAHQRRARQLAVEVAPFLLFYRVQGLQQVSVGVRRIVGEEDLSQQKPTFS